VIIWSAPKPALKTALSVLRDAFGEYALVSAKLPKQRPIRFVRVSLIGGTRINPVTYRSRVLVELFGPDPETVEAMHGTSSWALHNAQGTVVDGTVFVRGWEDEQGPVDNPHPEIIDMERWQFHGDLTLSTTTAVIAPGS
jgi:hypothetical protein